MSRFGNFFGNMDWQPSSFGGMGSKRSFYGQIANMAIGFLGKKLGLGNIMGNGGIGGLGGMMSQRGMGGLGGMMSQRGMGGLGGMMGNMSKMNKMMNYGNRMKNKLKIVSPQDKCQIF